jgi:uncharacterized protein (DUF433 family)
MLIIVHCSIAKPLLSWANLENSMTPTLNHYIEITVDVRNGKPRIAGTRITIADIVIIFLRMRQSLEIIAGKYDLAPAAVYAAMSYYNHRAEIDQSIPEDEAFTDEYMCDHLSLL